MKYKLVNPTTINGILYWQIQAKTRALKWVKYNQLGGFVNNATCLSQNGSCWIDAGSIVTDSMITQDVYIHSNCRIIDSDISGKGVVETESYINNCKITSIKTLWFLIKKKTNIIDKTIACCGILNNKITASGYWNEYHKDGLDIYCGQSFCKAGCVIASYREMWDALSYNNNLIEKHKNSIYFTNQKIIQNTEWLKSICKKELKRLNIKIEEGD